MNILFKDSLDFLDGCIAIDNCNYKLGLLGGCIKQNIFMKQNILASDDETVSDLLNSSIEITPLRPRSHENGTERNDVELFQKTKEFLQVFTRERLETFRSVPKSGRL